MNLLLISPASGRAGAERYALTIGQAALRRGWSVTAAVPQQRGSHGYLASDPEMDALFIASGYGVRAGALSGRISNVDVAPTIAKLLGVALPSAKGKPLPLQ